MKIQLTHSEVTRLICTHLNLDSNSVEIEIIASEVSNSLRSLMKAVDDVKPTEGFNDSLLVPRVKAFRQAAIDHGLHGLPYTSLAYAKYVIDNWPLAKAFIERNLRLPTFQENLWS